MKSALTNGSVFLALILGFAMLAYGDRMPWKKAPAHGPAWCEKHQAEPCVLCDPKLARGGTVVTRTRDPKEGECPNTLVKIELGPRVAERIGLTTVTVEARPVAEVVKANAETAYIPSAWARVAPRLAGVVREVVGQLDQSVEAGAVLAVLDAPELAKAKSELIQASAERDLRKEQYDAMKGLFDKRLATGREELESRSALAEAILEVHAAELQLRSLGMSAEQVATVVKDRDVTQRLEVLAPVGGTIVSASAVVGQNATTETGLFEVVTLERMWVAIDAKESDLTRIERGQRVAFQLESLAGKKFVGKVVATGRSVDEVTRTVRVYAEVKNPDALLRAHMFGRVEITVKSAEPRILVPRDAVQTDGDCSFVFVETSGNTFQSRLVEIGAVYDGGFEIKGGLAAGDKVATTGSFMLKTEAMKGEMGAG